MKISKYLGTFALLAMLALQKMSRFALQEMR